MNGTDLTSASTSPLSRSVLNYLSRDMYRVNGYLKAVDARLIASLSSWQSDQNICGSLVEIGVHHGKLFLILALSRREQEQALAIDLFEDDALNTGRYAGRSHALSKHATRLNVKLSDNEILKGDSLKLTANDILQRVGPVRMFSVDGGHLYVHVENDLRLAAETVLPEGIVIVDDFCNPEWPEVTFATYDFLKENNGALVPAIITKNKLYLTKPGLTAALNEHASNFAHKNPGIQLGSVKILDFTVPYLTVGIKDFLLDTARSRLSRSM